MLDSRYPDDFDGKFFSIQDKKGDYFSTTVSITKTTLRTVHCDRYSFLYMGSLRVNLWGPVDTYYKIG